MIFNLVLKNLKIIFRNPLTLILLVLAPIILISVIGISYSGNDLNSISIGLIKSDNSLINVSERNYFQFKKFLYLKDCIISLKRSEVDLCILENTIVSNNTIKSSEIKYYIDNTRPKISDILISNFNRLIDKKTKQISKKTVVNIFQEVNETVEFMQDNKLKLDKIQSNITALRKKLELFNSLFKSNKYKFDENYNQIKTNLLNLKNGLNDFNLSKKELKSDLNYMNSYISNLNDDSNSIMKEINTLSGLIETFAIISNSTQIYDYVDFNGLILKVSNLNNDLDYSSNEMIKLNRIVSNLEINLDLDLINNLIYNLDQIKLKLDSSSNNLDKLVNDVKDKENKIIDFNNKFTKKLNYFKSLISKNPNYILNPINRVNYYLFSNLKMVHKLAPTIVILFLLFISILLSNIIVSLEIHSKAYFRNLISPVPQSIFVISLIFTNLIIILFQILFLLLILYSYFGILNIFSNFWIVFIILIHLILLFSLIGFLFTYLIKSPQLSIIVTTFVILFMFLLSSVVIPIQIMPNFIYSIVQFNPVVIGINILREVFFFSKTINISFILNILILEIYILILFLVVIYVAILRGKKSY